MYLGLRLTATALASKSMKDTEKNTAFAKAKDMIVAGVKAGSTDLSQFYYLLERIGATRPLTGDNKPAKGTTPEWLFVPKTTVASVVRVIKYHRDGLGTTVGGSNVAAALHTAIEDVKVITLFLSLSLSLSRIIICTVLIFVCVLQLSMMDDDVATISSSEQHSLFGSDSEDDLFEEQKNEKKKTKKKKKKKKHMKRKKNELHGADEDNKEEANQGKRPRNEQMNDPLNAHKKAKIVIAEEASASAVDAVTCMTKHTNTCHYAEKLVDDQTSMVSDAMSTVSKLSNLITALSIKRKGSDAKEQESDGELIEREKNMQLKMDEMFASVTQRQVTLDEKEAEQEKRAEEFNNRKNEIEREIRERREDQDRREHDLKMAHDAMENREKKLREDEEIAKKELEILEEKKNDLRHRDICLDEREQRIDDREKELDERENEVRGRETTPQNSPNTIEKDNLIKKQRAKINTFGALFKRLKQTNSSVYNELMDNYKREQKAGTN